MYSYSFPMAIGDLLLAKWGHGQFTNFFGGGGKIFYDVGEFFLRSNVKSLVSAPPIEVNSCTKIY